MAFSREIIIGILQNVRFRIPKQEKNSYYTTIGNTLVRISNHCTWMYVWDNYLEQNPKCKGMNIVSLVFEDNGNTFSNDCLVLKRERKHPIKVDEYVFSLNGDGQLISRMDINTIINDLRRLQQSKDYTDSTGKSKYFMRISVNPTNNENKQYKSNNMKQTIKLTENELRNMIKGAIKKTINEVKDEHPSFVESRLHNHIKNMVREALNEISDTPKGQYMLGRLAGREDSRVLSGHPKAKRFGGNEPMSYAYERNLDQSDMGYDEEKYKELRDAFDDGYVEEFNKGANDDKDGEYKFADIQAGRDDWGIYY